MIRVKLGPCIEASCFTFIFNEGMFKYEEGNFYQINVIFRAEKVFNCPGSIVGKIIAYSIGARLCHII